MRKITFALAAVATLIFAGFDSKQAKAGHGHRRGGIHIGGRNVHLDVGNPHGWHGFYGHRSWYRGPVYGGWHDTSHWDFHMPGYIGHGNHFDYMPGHFDFHHSGHWDGYYGGFGW